VAFDITDRKKREKEIKDSLKEKETLLQEIQHRVKNNLQVISSLLNLQRGYIRDRKAREAFDECQNRVRAMSLVHEKLRVKKDLGKIYFGKYIHELANILLNSYGIQPDRVSLEFQTDNIQLDLNIAIPLGLILNELLSNSLKHAFADRRKGKISISLNRKTSRRIFLTVADNGTGLPSDYDVEAPRTLGMKLIRTLTAQINGKMVLYSNKGLEIKIDVPDKRTALQKK